MRLSLRRLVVATMVFRSRSFSLIGSLQGSQALVGSQTLVIEAESLLRGVDVTRENGTGDRRLLRRLVVAVTLSTEKLFAGRDVSGRERNQPET